MTLEEIEIKLQEIKDVSGDDEKAHSLADKLYFDFVKYIAEETRNIPIGKTTLSSLAKRVLKVEDIDFKRWCA